jgi:hypothetical protein
MGVNLGSCILPTSRTYLIMARCTFNCTHASCANEVNVALGLMGRFNVVGTDANA